MTKKGGFAEVCGDVATRAPIPRTLDQSHASEDLVNFALWLKKKIVRGRKLCDATVAGKVPILRQ